MTQALPVYILAHLWQSTIFVLAAGLLTVVFRGNRAQVRYWLWLSASLKFLVPFALLLNLGSYLETLMPAARQVASQIATPVVSWTIEEFSAPSLSGTLTQSTTATAATSDIHWLPIALLALWLAGFATVAFIRFRGWLRIRAAVRASVATGISHSVEIRMSQYHLGPAVVGVVRPVLLFPTGIAERLTPSELEAVLAHELCHVRRRDNLFAAIHMFVEAALWFHPLVWWISARLVEEREQACDEEVLRLGSQPEIYADAILNVCKFYVQSPLVCASGVSGASIRRRIEAIMLNRFEQLSRAKKLLLAGAGMAALVGPIAIGLLIAAGNVTVVGAQGRAQVEAQSPVSPSQEFDVAAIHPCNRNVVAPLREMGGLGETGPSPNLVIKKCVTVMTLLQDAYITFADGQQRAVAVQAPPIEGAPAWISSDRYTIEAKAEGTPGQPMMLGPMMQSLLEDRFHLKLHRETRSGPAYELTVAKGGSKLKATNGSCAIDVPPAAVPRDPATGNPVISPDGHFHAPQPGPGQQCHLILMLNDGPNRLLQTRGMTLDAFSAWLFKMTDHTIVDKTGLTGKYDIRLEYFPGETASRIPTGDNPNEADIQPEATLLTAIQQQLGLKLTSVKGTRQIIVIDHIERPSGN